MDRTQIYLSVEQKKALRGIAETEGVTTSEVIRRAVDDLIRVRRGDEALSRFRSVLDRCEEDPADLSDGETFVEETRSRDLGRLSTPS